MVRIPVLPRTPRPLLLLIFSCVLGAGWLPVPVRAETPEQIQAKIERLENEIASLRELETKALEEMAAGLYCSKCMHTKTEIEKNESFEKHLRDVGGEIVPATPEMLERKRSEFERQIEDLEARIEFLRRQLERAEKLGEELEKNRQAKEQREKELKMMDDKRAREDARLQEETNRLSNDKAIAPDSPASAAPGGGGVWMTPDQVKTQQRIAVGNAAVNLVASILRAVEISRVEKQNAAAQAEAQAQAVAEIAQQRYIEKALAVRKEQDIQAESLWLRDAKRQFAGFLDHLGLSEPASNFVMGALGRSGEALKDELHSQLIHRPELDLEEAAKGAISKELSGLKREMMQAIQERAYEQMPPDIRIQLREVNAVGSFFNFVDSERVVANYEILCQKEIFDQIDSFTPEMAPQKQSP